MAFIGGMLVGVMFALFVVNEKVDKLRARVERLELGKPPIGRVIDV